MPLDDPMTTRRFRLVWLAAGHRDGGGAGPIVPVVDDFNATLEEKLKTLPAKPGVYLFKNDKDDVIYVGKAISLRDRVRSYFQKLGSTVSPKVKIMVGHIRDLEYIVTDSEVEALILEATLIKEKQPWYNVRLKDDKAYPYLKVTDEPFPRVMVVRRPQKNSRTFGPYTSPRAVRDTMDFLRKLFPLRTCSLDLSGELNYRPCLLYHIDRCGAPCAGLQTEDQYDALVEEVILFLEGRQQRLIPELEKKMRQAASELKFEQAARIRDQIQALSQVVERQKVVSTKGGDHDYVGLARTDDNACVQVFFVRDGQLSGRDHFFLEVPEGTTDDELLSAFLKQYYTDAVFVPQEVLLSTAVEEADVMAAWLTEKRGTKVAVRQPQRGEKKRLVDMVARNAQLVLGEREATRSRRTERVEGALAELQDVLGLPEWPRRIEAFDISNIQGREAVGSMVVFTNGSPDSAEYRRFRIRDIEGADDYAMMHQVVTRRFLRGLQEQQDLDELASADAAAETPASYREAAAQAKFAVMPDLILIDGGKGQLGVVRDALRELDLAHIPTIGLAEKLEELFTEPTGDPLVLDPDSHALHLLQNVRDEAHRFALNYHRQLRERGQSRSILDSIEGVGPKRKRELLRAFGSVRGIREATVDQLLAAVPGLPRKVATRIYHEVRDS